MTTTAPPRARDAAPSTSGSGAAADGGPRGAPRGEFTCEVCGRVFDFKLALFNHQKSHDLKPGQQPGVQPQIGVRKAPKLSQKELGELQVELAKNIETVGGALHALLMGVKAFRLQNPDLRIRIPRTRIELQPPALETHLPLTIMACSEVTARTLVEHAGENETLLRWLVRFNGWFRGGEVTSLVGAHVIAGAMTAGVRNGMMEAGARMAGLGQVLAQVEAENAELRHQVQQLQAQRAAQETGAWRPPADERGAGG